MAELASHERPLAGRDVHTADFANNGALAQALGSQVKGQVISPGDEVYDQARTVFYGSVDARPALIVRPTDAADVSAAVLLARDSGLELAVRSGGHSVAGHSTVDGGIVIDLRDMRAVEIDPASHTAWAEAGVTAGEYTSAANVYGLATGFGDTGSVGIGGITLGGGVGYLVRKYGLTIDNLLAAEIVTADGELLYTDPHTHADLFWAIRGGGGNFGVATRFKFRLVEVDNIYGGMLFLPASPDTIAGFIAEAEAAPDELSTIANVMLAPPLPFVPAEHHGKMMILAMMAYSGPVEEAERAIAPFRSLAAPLTDMLRPMRYPELFVEEEGEYHPTAASRTMFMNSVRLQEARLILDTLQAADASMSVVQLRVLGGAYSRVPADATAYAHRSERIMVNVAAFYEGQEERRRRDAWVADFARALSQGSSATYVNFVGSEGSGDVSTSYPPGTYQRLAEIKARYDPGNLFRRNHNIPPAAGFPVQQGG